MAKYQRLRARLEALDLARPEQMHIPELAPAAWLELAHEPAYVASVLAGSLDEAAERRLGLPMTAALAARSRASVGGTVLTARLALEHGIACNLAGGSHHAHAGFGSGFCVMNDVAVASLVLLEEGLVERVLVLDLDVHQGDGTASILAGDPRVTTVSVHCRTNFPTRKARSDLDLALDPGMTDGPYLGLTRRLVPQLLASHRPCIVVYVAGVDPHERDKLGRLELSDRGLLERERFVLGSCRAAGIPVACVMGGGYGTDVDEVVERHTLLHRAASELPIV